MFSGLMAPEYDFLIRSVEELASREDVHPLIIIGSPSHRDIKVIHNKDLYWIVTYIVLKLSFLFIFRIAI